MHYYYPPQARMLRYTARLLFTIEWSIRWLGALLLSPIDWATMHMILIPRQLDYNAQMLFPFRSGYKMNWWTTIIHRRLGYKNILMTWVALLQSNPCFTNVIPPWLGYRMTAIPYQIGYNFNLFWRVLLFRAFMKSSFTSFSNVPRSISFMPTILHIFLTIKHNSTMN